MKNDKYVVMYCNNCIATFNDYKQAIEYIENCRKSDFYYNDNNHEFSIHIKVEF